MRWAFIVRNEQTVELGAQNSIVQLPVEVSQWPLCITIIVDLFSTLIFDRLK